MSSIGRSIPDNGFSPFRIYLKVASPPGRRATARSVWRSLAPSDADGSHVPENAAATRPDWCAHSVPASIGEARRPDAEGRPVETMPNQADCRGLCGRPALWLTVRRNAFVIRLDLAGQVGLGNRNEQRQQSQERECSVAHRHEPLTQGIYEQAPRTICRRLDEGLRSGRRLGDRVVNARRHRCRRIQTARR